MNIGIVVEGPDDTAVYRVLLRRIDHRIERVHARECGGRQKLKNKFVPLLNEFARNPAAFNLGEVLVIRDSDCRDPNPLEQELEHILTRSDVRLDFRVLFHATKCKLESWLLADEEAINNVSVRRGGPGGIQRIEEDLESLREADDLYRKTLSQAGLQDTDAVMKEIAERARLERIAERCPRFHDFIRKAKQGLL